MKKASESQRGNSSKGAVSQVRKGSSKSEVETLNQLAAARASSGGALLELEQAVNKAMALLQAQAQELSEYRESGWEDEHRGSFAAGIICLGYDTASGLRRAFNEAFQAIQKERAGAR